jgi:nucleoside-diphosphate-sugar epimerase
VIARFIQAARRGKPLEIHGDGKQTRDFTFIANVVEANLLAADAPRLAGDVFNVACGSRLSVLDIAASLEAILGQPLARRHTPARPGDVRDTLADVSRARERMAYVPRVDFAEGLQRTVAAFPA